jgi:nicotinamidase-related amidase
MLPLPNHYDASKVGNDPWKVDYAKLSTDAQAYAKQVGLRKAGADKEKVCLMMIDVQNTFCLPNFELFVGGRSGTGAIDDNRRLIEFLYQNADKVTEVAATLDTHVAFQIFHPIFWVDANGDIVPPFTMIAHADVVNGKYRVNPAVARYAAPTSDGRGNYMGLQDYALHYTKRLEDTGKFALTVWPYHAMLGGIGHALVSSVEEAVFFHSQARASQPKLETKGGIYLTENYSVLKPEVTDGPHGEIVGQRNSEFYNRLMSFDKVIIAGQAKSHCVAWTIEDMLSEIVQVDAELAKKVYLLEDCTSPVVIPGVHDYTDEANDAFRKFFNAGMNVVNTQKLDWLR